jgi:peptidoglycan/xylan/chitin deacetylase (PgdA/CDA1 family)
MKDRVKRALGHTLFTTRLHELLLRNTAAIVAFHRVKNTTGTEALTVSLPLFERYCAFFKKHFDVVPLHEIVDRLERGKKLNGELAITFDDGYRDNYENAAPVLLKLALPATFFVVTKWIGSETVPWWDSMHGTRHPWMTWPQVRSLHRLGFAIGVHTRTHADLGSIDVRAAERETVGARHDLEAQLGAPVELFAYPYGSRANLTDSNRQIVREAGFRCCCSCFGGLVAPATDPFHLARVPVTPRYPSPHAFGLEVALGRSVLETDGLTTSDTDEPSCSATSEATGS